MSVDLDKSFVTSDHHFLSWQTCKWGFLKAFTHEEELEMIKKWNSTVSSNDTVFYLGDFIDSDSETCLEACRNALNGHIVLVKGNHDFYFSDSTYQKLFDGVYEHLDFEDLKISMQHVPYADVRPGWRTIYGHLHRMCNNMQNAAANSFCCCVSRNNGYPVKLADAIAKMDQIRRLQTSHSLV